MIVQDASFTWRWIAACFAMQDSDGDGQVSARVGRHGDIHGDELSSYLLLQDRKPELIDEYLAASPDGRFLAVIIGGHLWLIDGHTLNRWNLSLAGTGQRLPRVPGALGPAVVFSSDERAAFVRMCNRDSELVIVDLPPRDVSSVFRTDAEIVRFEFVDASMQVFTVPPGIVDDSTQTNLAPRRCRGSAASFTVFRSKPDPTTRTDVSLPKHRPAPMPPERVLARYHECTVDGTPLLASSADGRHHLAATSFQSPFTVELGPLHWTSGKSHRNYCPWEYR